MLFFLLLLSSYGVYSLPLQENCEESQAAFHVCLRKLSYELPDFRSSSDYNAIRSVFLQCGAKNSDCYLQKTLMMMMDFVPNPVKHADYIDTTSCSWNLPYESSKSCENMLYNEYGFYSDMAKASDEYLTCRLDYARSQDCSEEIVENLEKHLNADRHVYFGYVMPLFVFNVQMKARNNDMTIIKYSESSSHTENCAETEKAFQDCVRDEDLKYSNATVRKDAFIKCGAEKSDCYLQKHVMKMVNIVIEHADFPVGEFERAAWIPEVYWVDNKNIECEKDGYDEHGFPRPDGEFGFLTWYCRAERARANPNLSQSVYYFLHEAMVKYQSALDYFVAQQE